MNLLSLAIRRILTCIDKQGTDRRSSTLPVALRELEATRRVLQKHRPEVALLRGSAVGERVIAFHWIRELRNMAEENKAK